MNAVRTNVTVFGQPGYPFWTRDIALYYPGAQELYLDSNIRNFSGGPLTPNVFYAHGVDGFQVDESSHHTALGPNEVSANSPVLDPIPYGQGIGIQVGEVGDLLYNNLETPTTAWHLTFNLYTGNSEVFENAWNVPAPPAWPVHFAPGFPLLPLFGSIVGTPWQGGNFWWDYGLTLNPYNGADNPFGVLP
ncbi:MAG: hypothetical protein ACRECT_08675 [Thermoplasmata archaeon]